MILQPLILRIRQLEPTLFELKTEQIRAYTKMKLYSPETEKATIIYSKN